MKNSVLFLPLLVPLVTAIVCLANWKRIKVQQWAYFTGSVITLALSIVLIWRVWHEGIIHVQAGKWRTPVGITLVADMLSAIMVLTASVINFVVYFYIRGGLDKNHQAGGFYPMAMLMIFGVMGSFLAGDVFNLYVWFEVMLVASFVLITLGGTKEQVEGAIKYVSLNFLSTTIFLAGVGVLYGTAGTLNMADLAVKLSERGNQGLVSLASVFFIICFGIKAALFPLYFWLPASYHTPPIAITGLMAGLLTKVGVYSLIRFFTLIFTHDVEFTHTILLYAAGFTMLLGILGAIVQNDFRKILSFNIIAHIGYMVLGLALYSSLAITGTLFYVVQHIIVNTNLFLISGIIYQIDGSYHLQRLGGFYEKFPLLALCFTISAFSLAGIPPFSGFWGELMLVQSGLNAGQYGVVAIALLVSLLTLFSMIKIWVKVFLRKKSKDESQYPDQKTFIKNNPFVMGAVTILVFLILGIGLFPNPLVTLANKTAKQLLNSRSYIHSVLRTP